jgi:AbrB family looped-hinge helix DNA binding protein
MTSSTVSAKYQIVIPKALRKKLEIKPGQKVYFRQNKKNELVIDTKSPIEDLYGAFEDDRIWGDDPAETIRKDRDEWD